jgi:hypothetical protein
MTYRCCSKKSRDSSIVLNREIGNFEEIFDGTMNPDMARSLDTPATTKVCLELQLPKVPKVLLHTAPFDDSDGTECSVLYFDWSIGC